MIDSSDQLRFVLSPDLDQSLVIARLLRKHFPVQGLVGVAMPGDAVVSCAEPYVRTVALADLGKRIELFRFIPTGNLGTRFLLEQGDVTLGEVTLGRGALRFYDKHWSIDAARHAGLLVPQTWSSRCAIDRYPVFFKSALEGGGVRGIARSAKDLPDGDDDLVLQEFIDSAGTYGVGFIAQSGKLIVACAHFEPVSYPREGGSAVVIERYHDERLIEYTRRLVEACDYSGWGLLEFKHCPVRNDFVFMELNAKFWASCEFTFRNEPRFPRLLFGVDAVARPVERMIFLHRAAARGPWCLLRQVRSMVAGAEVRSAWRSMPRALATGLAPRGARRLLRKWL